MVNIDMVNARTSCLKRALFCEFLLILGRFLWFESTVKYMRIFEINQIAPGIVTRSDSVRKILSIISIR